MRTGIIRLAVAMLLFFLLQISIFATDSGEKGRQMEEYNDKLEQIRSERSRLERDLSNATGEKQREEAQRDQIQREIAMNRQELQLLQDRYGLLERRLTESRQTVTLLEEEVAERRTRYQERYRLYLTRLRGMQLTGTGTVTGLLLGTDRYVDYLTFSDSMQRVAAYDREMIASIREERLALEEEQQTLLERQSALQAEQQMLEEERQGIDALRQRLEVQERETARNLQDIQRMEQEYLADLARNQAAEQAVQAELERLIRQTEQSENPYAGGAMLWPVPGFYDISSYYGWRFGNTDFHKGNDIYGPGILGKEVVAANDGVVTLANWEYVEGRGYGRYIMIDHGIDDNGDSIATLYAHLSHLQVAVGDVVERGEVIGNVGSTGWSTGPHLHFEVRINKVQVDSLPYIKGQ